jgi:hypothetical protein
MSTALGHAALKTDSDSGLPLNAFWAAREGEWSEYCSFTACKLRVLVCLTRYARPAGQPSAVTSLRSLRLVTHMDVGNAASPQERASHCPALATTLSRF